MYDRNANTGATPGTDRELRMAQQTVFLESRAPSHIVLPVIPPR
jgi:predicted acyl esterase